MDEETGADAGIMVLRVWRDEGEHEVRARICSTLDVTRHRMAVTAAFGATEIAQIVEEWVRYFTSVSRPRRDRDDPATPCA